MTDQIKAILNLLSVSLCLYPERPQRIWVFSGPPLVSGIVLPGRACSPAMASEAGRGDGGPLGKPKWGEGGLRADGRKLKQQKVEMCSRHRIPSENQIKIHRHPSPEPPLISSSSFPQLLLRKVPNTHLFFFFFLFQGHPWMIPMGVSDYK